MPLEEVFGGRITPSLAASEMALAIARFRIGNTLDLIDAAVPATTNTLYDVFAFDNAGAINVEALAWTNDTTRATAITVQNGYLAKAATPARRYVGTFRTTGVSGQTEDSGFACANPSKRFVWNYYNRVRRPLCRQESTTSWTYATATVRQANASTGNQVSLVVGFQEALIDLTITTHAEANATITAVIGFGEGTVTTPVTATLLATALAGSVSADASGVVNGGQGVARLYKYAPLGATTYTWEEWVSGATFTFYGTPATPSGPSAERRSWRASATTAMKQAIQTRRRVNSGASKRLPM